MVSINFNKTNLFSGLNLKQPQIQLNKKEELTLKIDSTIGDTFTPTAKTQGFRIKDGSGTMYGGNFSWTYKGDGMYELTQTFKNGRTRNSTIKEDELMREIIDAGIKLEIEYVNE